jgi:hypothetical protein
MSLKSMSSSGIAASSSALSGLSYRFVILLPLAPGRTPRRDDAHPPLPISMHHRKHESRIRQTDADLPVLVLVGPRIEPREDKAVEDGRGQREAYTMLEDVAGVLGSSHSNLPIRSAQHGTPRFDSPYLSGVERPLTQWGETLVAEAAIRRGVANLLSAIMRQAAVAAAASPG